MGLSRLILLDTTTIIYSRVRGYSQLVVHLRYSMHKLRVQLPRNDGVLVLDTDLIVRTFLCFVI